MPYKAFISYSHAADGKLAPAIQSALHRFAKPWYKLRAVRVFRDKTSLSANPALWPEIQKALDESEYFLLLASPGASSSPWIQREISRWLARSSSEKFLIVLTDGELKWDDRAGDFDWERTTALPAILRKTFQEEPLFVDLRWARTEEDLSIKNPGFTDAIATIGATLHGRSKDEMVGEDVRQHRRTIQLSTAAVLFLAAFAAIAIWQAAVATDQRQLAESRQHEAERQLSRVYVQSGVELLREGNSAGLLELLEATRAVGGNEEVTRSRKGIWAGWHDATVGKLEHVLGHESHVLGVAVLPDEDTLATVTDAGRLRLWSVATDSPQAREFERSAAVTSVAFSPDGRLVATASEDDTVRTQFVSSGEPYGVPVHHKGGLTSVVFSGPDAGLIATASGDSTARLWNVTDGTPNGDPLVHSDEVSALTFSPNGKYLVTAAGETVRFWDVAGNRGSMVGSFEIESSTRVLDLAFSPDGATLATALWDMTCRLWNLKTGEPQGPPLDHQAPVVDVAFSQDGSLVATASLDRTARVWEISSGEPYSPSLWHGEAATAVAFSPDQRYLISAAQDNTARLWDLSGRPLREIKPPRTGFNIPIYPSVLGFSSSGRLLAEATDSNVRLWNVSSGKKIELALGQQSERVDHAIVDVAFSPNESIVVTASRDGTARIWSALDGTPQGVPLQHGGEVLDVEFSPDGGYLATAAWDKAGRLWDLTDGTQTLLNHEGPVVAVSFSPNGSLVGTASGDGTGRLWSVSTGQPYGPPLRHAERVTSIEFSPNGKLVATASWDRTVRLWDVERGESHGAALRHQNPVTKLEFGPGGRFLATASQDGTVQLWALGTGQPYGQPYGQPLYHSGQITSLAFSQDGRILATASVMGTAYLWDVLSTQAYGPALPRGSQVLASSPNSRFVAIGNSNGALHVWHLPEDTLDLAEMELRTWLSLGLILDDQRLVQDLTWPQWQKLQGVQLLADSITDFDLERERDDFLASVITGREIPEYPTEVAATPVEKDSLFSGFQPYEEIEPTLEKVLIGFATDMRQHRWMRLLNYFSPAHLTAQMNMYEHDDWMFAGMGTAGKREIDEVIQRYLKETLGLWGLKDLNEVSDIRFTELERQGSEWHLSFEIRLEDGMTVPGSCWVKPGTWELVGAYG